MKTRSPEQQQLADVSKLLTAIHKELMTFQLEDYASSRGPITSAGQKLQLLLNDSEFQWLRVLSQLISQIDGIVFQKEPVTPTQILSAVGDTRNLFFNQHNPDFHTQYQRVTQAKPEILLLHQQLKGLLDLQ